MRHDASLLVAGLLASFTWLRSAEVPGELVLSGNYRLAALTGMPAPVLASGLRFEPRRYPAYDAIEWQVRLQAPVEGQSPICEQVRSADFRVRFPKAGGVTLHWNKGSHAEATDFQPRIETLEPGRPFALESFGGRSSDGAMPYFNLAGEGGGLIVAVGWPGDWRASFEALPEQRVRIVAGLKRSRFRLRAGERVRLPSVLVMAYAGDWIEGQNRFRRLMLEHFTPQSHPPLELMPVAASVHGMIGFNDTTETNLIALATDIAGLRLPLDTYWLDAGWNLGGFPRGQGNPQADPARFPHGLASLGRTVRATGLRFLVWFEPERVMRGTWLEREHPEWLLRPSATPAALAYQERDGFHLLDLGNTEARAWALEALSKDVREAGIGVYRQDFNAYPAFFWHTGEAADETGLREVRYVNGLYDFLDDLARRHPGLILDNCASGGRRLDFEMMRRCVVLWRSDSCWGEPAFPRNVQAMTHGLSLWLPLHGLGAAATDTVALRSGMGACASFAIQFREPAAVEALRRHLDRYLKVRALFARDYYPLTPWSDNPARLLAFQFHDPASGRGLVQVFRGPAAAEESVRLRLRGLDPAVRYSFADWDGSGAGPAFGGGDLMTGGLPVTSLRTREAIVLDYSPSAPLPTAP